MKQLNSKSSNILTKSYRQIDNLVVTNTTHIPRQKINKNEYQNQQNVQYNYYKNVQQPQPGTLYMSPHHTNTQSNPVLKLDLKAVGASKNALQSST